MTEHSTQHSAILQSWMESEMGWGQKPWGNTLHLSREDMRQYNSAYWRSMPDETPDWYIQPNAEGKEVLVSEQLYQKLLDQKANPSLSNEFGGYGIPCGDATSVILHD